MSTILTISTLSLGAFSSLYYVYRVRGEQRYASLTEYLRKGWPIFAPLNCILYLFTRRWAQKPIMDVKKFPDLKILEENWQTIREEAEGLLEKGYFEKTKDPKSNSYYDVGFRTFYKYGWGKFYLKWYGATHNSALKHCPKTVEILKKTRTVNGAMFSYLPVGSKLTRHLDPVACSLRYHLGLKTPESDSCFINVDGVSYSWRDGEGFIFDETYLHFAKNNAPQGRLILMCDVERPMFFIGSLVNLIYKGLMRMTVVPNEVGDPRGLTNAIFSGISPILQRTKRLKKSNRPLYLLVKYSVNTVAILLILSPVVLGLSFILR